MQKNNFVLIMALGLVLSPLAPLHAENHSISINTNIKAETETETPRAKDIINKAKTEREMLRTDAKAKIEEIKKDRDDLKASKVEHDALRADAKAKIEEIKKDRDDLKTSINTRRAELVKELRSEKAGLRVKLGTAAKARVKKNLDAIFVNMTKKTTNLEQLEVKLSTKIDTLKNTQGKNVAEAEAQLVIAKNALAKAKIEIEAAKNLASTQADTQTSREELQSLIVKARESIRSAASEYRKVVSIITRGKTEMSTNTTVESSTTTSVVNQ